MSKVSVLGGLGFIGSNLVEKLAEDKAGEIEIIDNLHSGSVENLRGLAYKMDIHFDDAAKIGRFHSDTEEIYHLGMYSASPMYREYPLRVAEVSKGMISVLEHARRRDCPVVFASTSSIYNGQPGPHKETMTPLVKDYYIEARYSCERLANLYCDMYGMDVAAMRFFSVYGPHEEYKVGYENLITKFLRDLLVGRPPHIYGDGSQRRDFVHVDDVVRAMRLAMEKNKGFNVYNVGTGRNESINSVVEYLRKVLRVRTRPKYVPIPTGYVHIMETLADTAKAQEMLGFKAKIMPAGGIARQIDYYSKLTPSCGP